MFYFLQLHFNRFIALFVYLMSHINCNTTLLTYSRKFYICFFIYFMLYFRYKGSDKIISQHEKGIYETQDACGEDSAQRHHLHQSRRRQWLGRHRPRRAGRPRRRPSVQRRHRLGRLGRLKNRHDLHRHLRDDQGAVSRTNLKH